jgi:hypothetical protein
VSRLYHCITRTTLIIARFVSTNYDIMDPLSITANVVAIVQLSGLLLQWFSGVKDAPKDCKQIKVEMANLYSLLIRLHCHLEQEEADDPWYTAIWALNVPNGPLDQYSQALNELEAKSKRESKIQKLQQIFIWQFTKEEIGSILHRIERLKTLLNIALNLDHLYVC